MTDQLYLSVWLERHAQADRLRHFQTLLRLVPFSQREKQPQSAVRIQAVNVTEPPLLERAMNGPIDVADVLGILEDYKGDDVGIEVESWWDLWQFEDDWELRPARISISCFGPDFDNGTARHAMPQETLRIDFGVDSRFLPDLEIQGSAKMAESNIRSLLRLVHEVDSALPLKERTLETETGENFAERLKQVLVNASAGIS